jgi:hypothetical protein
MPFTTLADVLPTFTAVTTLFIPDGNVIWLELVIAELVKVKTCACDAGATPRHATMKRTRGIFVIRGMVYVDTSAGASI